MTPELGRNERHIEPLTCQIQVEAILLESPILRGPVNHGRGAVMASPVQGPWSLLVVNETVEHSHPSCALLGGVCEEDICARLFLVWGANLLEVRPVIQKDVPASFGR